MGITDKTLLLFIISSLRTKVFLTFLCLTISTAILDLIGIALIYPYVSAVMNPKYFDDFTYFKVMIAGFSHANLVIALSFTMVLFYLAKAFLHGYLLKKQSQISAHYTQNVTDSFLKKILNAKFEVFNHLSTPRLAGIAFSNTIHVSLALQAVAQCICELVFLVFLVLGFLLVSPEITLAILVVFSIYLLLIYKPLGRKIANFGKQQSEVENLRHRILHSIVASIRDIKIMGLAHVFEKKNADISTQFAQMNWMYSTAQGLTRVYLEAFILIAFVVAIQIMFAGSSEIENIVPVVGIAVVSALRALPSIAKLLSSINSYRYSRSFVENLLLTDRILTSSEQYKIDDSLYFNNLLQVKNLSFSYGKNEVLSDINIDIDKGKSVGIVGPSGSGKSTLLDLITGLLKPQTGNFYLDGESFDPFLSHSLQNILGYVPQSITLFEDTISYNITFENEPDMDLLNKVLKISNLAEFVDALETRLETKIGEGGIALSGGQRQRIGIARALYKQPQILIFDEATSALDALTEQYLVDEIFALKGFVTTVVVAHKLTTVVGCDCIYVLHKGCVVAFGTHHELMKSCPLYSKMFDLQNGLVSTEGVSDNAD